MQLSKILTPQVIIAVQKVQNISSLSVTMKNIRKIHIISLIISCFFISGVSSKSPVDNLSPYSAVLIRERLVNQIDSLDIEKQLKKRIGQDIADIEHQQTLYLDSLNSLRKTIQNNLSVSPKHAKNQYLAFINSFSHPVTFFDWLIVVTSAVAILSCLILITGILRAISKKMKPKIKVQQQIKTKAQYPANHLKKENLDSKKALSQLETESLNQLRSKIKNDSTFYESSNPRPATQILKITPPQPSQAPANDLESQIFQAFQMGSDIHELSRKFQISTDHVSLILKIKGSSPIK